jgi:hypothetical protein
VNLGRPPGDRRVSQDAATRRVRTLTRMDDVLTTVIDPVNKFLYTYLLVNVLVGAGLCFTYRTRAVQFRMAGPGVRRGGGLRAARPSGDRGLVRAPNSMKFDHRPAGGRKVNRSAA